MLRQWGKSASEVSANSYSEPALWRTCEFDNHIYERSIGEKVRSFRRLGTDPATCPICSNRLTLPGVNDLATTHPRLAEEFRGAGDAGPDVRQINAGDKRKFDWLCPEGHKYDKPVNKRALFGEDCPYCSGARTLSGFNDLRTVHPIVAESWHPTSNHPRKPEEIAPWSSQKFFWLCDRNHEYAASVAHRSEGKGCPYCANKKLLVGFNDLATVRPDLAAEYDGEKNDVGPDGIIAGSNKDCWWLCGEGHGWRQKPAVRLQGKGCADCAEIGFHPNRPAQLYFIVHEVWRAGKIGITNLEAREIRLNRHGAHGWRLVWQMKDDSGAKIRDLETRTLKWVRADLGLPQFLGKREMSATGGWTETFSIAGLEEARVIQAIEKFWKELG